MFCSALQMSVLFICFYSALLHWICFPGPVSGHCPLPGRVVSLGNALAPCKVTSGWVSAENSNQLTLNRKPPEELVYSLSAVFHHGIRSVTSMAAP